MDNNFIYLRSFESILETQFLPIGHNGIQKPDGNHNIRIDSYFDAKPIDLAENISKFFITKSLHCTLGYPAIYYIPIFL